MTSPTTNLLPTKNHSSNYNILTTTTTSSRVKPSLTHPSEKEKEIDFIGRSSVKVPQALSDGNIPLYIASPKEGKSSQYVNRFDVRYPFMRKAKDEIKLFLEHQNSFQYVDQYIESTPQRRILGFQRGYHSFGMGTLMGKAKQTYESSHPSHSLTTSPIEMFIESVRSLKNEEMIALFKTFGDWSQCAEDNRPLPALKSKVYKAIKSAESENSIFIFEKVLNNFLVTSDQNTLAEENIFKPALQEYQEDRRVMLQTLISLLKILTGITTNPNKTPPLLGKTQQSQSAELLQKLRSIYEEETNDDPIPFHEIASILKDSASETNTNPIVPKGYSSQDSSPRKNTRTLRRKSTSDQSSTSSRTRPKSDPQSKKLVGNKHKLKRLLSRAHLPKTTIKEPDSPSSTTDRIDNNSPCHTPPKVSFDPVEVESANAIDMIEKVLNHPGHTLKKLPQDYIEIVDGELDEQGFNLIFKLFEEEIDFKMASPEVNKYRGTLNKLIQEVIKKEEFKKILDKFPHLYDNYLRTHLLINFGTLYATLNQIQTCTDDVLEFFQKKQISKEIEFLIGDKKIQLGSWLKQKEDQFKQWLDTFVFLGAPLQIYRTKIKEHKTEYSCTTLQLNTLVPLLFSIKTLRSQYPEESIQYSHDTEFIIEIAKRPQGIDEVIKHISIKDQEKIENFKTSLQANLELEKFQTMSVKKFPNFSETIQVFSEGLNEYSTIVKEFRSFLEQLLVHFEEIPLRKTWLEQIYKKTGSSHRKKLELMIQHPYLQVKTILRFLLDSP